MRASHFLPLLSLASLALFSTLAPSAQAAVYQQSFSSPVNGLPEHWSAAGYFDPTQGIARITTTTSFTALTQERSTSKNANGNSWIYYTGKVGTEVEGGIFDNMTASVIVNSSLGASSAGTHFGLMVRAATPPTTSKQLRGYYVTLGNNGGITYLSVYKDPGTAGGGDPGTLLPATVSGNPFSIAKDTDYLFTISAIQNTITGSLYAWDPVEEAFSTLLGSVTAVDSTYSSGLFGFRTNHNGGDRTTYWRDLEITTIPEPGTAALLIPFGLAAWLISRKTRE